MLLPGFNAYIRHRRYVVAVGGQQIGEENLRLQLGRPDRSIDIVPLGAVSGLDPFTLTLIVVGVTLAVSAVAVLTMHAAPTAASREDSTKTASAMFDGPQNNVEQGHPVALIYGRRMRVGSVVVSAGISTADANEASLSTSVTNPTIGTNPGYVGSTPGITGSPAGANWNVNLAKGGKAAAGTTRAAQEDPDNLQSLATARIVDLLGEGEIGGLIDGMKSIYFDDTPVQNPDGSFNFAGVAIEQRVGLPTQDFMPGYTDTEDTTSVDTEVKVSTGPVTRTISDPDATVARVTIRIPQLYQQNTTNGDMKVSQVEVAISVQADGGGFTEVTRSTFNGKTTSGYQRSIDVRLPAGQERDIRVTRITPDSTLATLQNETRFDLLTEVVEAKLSYPDSALVGLTVDARQFGSSIPTRSYEVEGLIIEVPSNWDPDARTYTGVWDGTFKRAPCDNGAWIYRDLLVNRRYGLGARVTPDAIDKWALYAIAQHNDEQVPNFQGGTQPRYTCNCAVTNPMQAYDLLASIASNFRAFSYWGSGTVMVAQDSPADPSVLVAPANVSGGQISYGRITPAEKRRSAAVVYWNNPDDGYKLDPEVYEDPDLIRRFGRRSGDDVTAFGCTNQGQAHRMARWVLEDEAQGSNSTADYEVGDDHAFAQPGAVASVADPMFVQQRRGGRVRGADADSVTVDRPYAFTSSNYLMRVMLPDGSVSTRPVASGPGTFATIQLGGDAWATPPLPGAIWTIESDQVANRLWRIRSIATDAAPYKVSATLYDPTKWDRVEQNRDISPPNFLDLPTGPLKPPGAIHVFEFLLPDGTSSIPCAQVSWDRSPDPRVTFYQAQYLEPGANWEPFADSIDLSRDLRNIVFGLWSFRVRALDSLGNKTAWVLAENLSLDGQTDSIPNVIGLTFQTDDRALQTMLVWMMPEDPRPLEAEVLFSAGGGDISGAISLIRQTSQEYVVSQSGRYWVRLRFLDSVAIDPPHIDIVNANLPTLRYGDDTPVDTLKPAEPAATNSKDPNSAFGDITVGAARQIIAQAQQDIANQGQALDEAYDEIRAAASTAGYASQRATSALSSSLDGALNRNSVFSDWPDGQANPTGWNAPGSPRQGGLCSPYAVQIGGGQEISVADQVRIVDGAPVVLELDIRMTGNTHDVVLGLQAYQDDQTTQVGGWSFRLDSLPAVDHDNAISSGAVNNESFRFRPYVDARLSGAREFRLYCGIDGGSSMVANIDRCCVRLASASEITAQQAAVDVAAARADITKESETRASETGALAQDTSTLKAQMDGDQDSYLKGQVEQNAQAGADLQQAFGSFESKVEAQFNGDQGSGLLNQIGSKASVDQLNSAISSEQEARAQDYENLSGQVGTQAGRIDDLREVVVTPSGATTKVIMQLDSNGHVVGYYATNDGHTGDIVFSFDHFTLLRPDGTVLLTNVDNQLYLPNVVVDHLQNDSATVFGGANSTSPVSGKYTSATGPADPRSSILTAAVVMKAPGWITAIARVHQSYSNAPPTAPYFMALSCNGQDDAASFADGSAYAENVSTQGRWYASQAGTYTISFDCAGHTSITWLGRVLAVTGLPFTSQ